MTDFLLKSSISLLVFLTFYHLVLEGEKMHRFNRFYLLISLVVSFIIPFMSFEIIQIIPVQASENMPIVPNFANVNTTPIVTETNHLVIILAALYGLVTAVLVFRFVKNIYKLHLKKQSCPVVKYKNANLVLVDEKALPHSFLNNIFVNFSEYQSQEIEDELFTHELVHVNQKHTLDILFIELIKTLFWFNPLVYFYKKAIQLNHEFLADEKVVHSYNNVVYYQNLLLQKSSNVETIYLASNLNFLITKKRLIMMTKSTSKELALLKKAAIVPILTGLIYLFCIDVVAQQPTTKSEFPHKELNEYYGNTRVIIKDKAGKVIADKKYPELTQEQKMQIPPPPPAPKKTKLTETEFSDFKNTSKYAVWVDGKHIKNSELDNYKASQFVYYQNSSVNENAKSEKFPQSNQVNLYTENGYKNTFLKKDKSIGGTIEITDSKVGILNKESPSKSKYGYIIEDVEINNEQCLKVIRETGEIEFYNISGFQIASNGEILKSFIDFENNGKEKIINGKKYTIKNSGSIDGKVTSKGYIDKNDQTIFYSKIGNELSYFNKWGKPCDQDGRLL